MAVGHWDIQVHKYSKLCIKIRRPASTQSEKGYQGPGGHENFSDSALEGLLYVISQLSCL